MRFTRRLTGALVSLLMAAPHAAGQGQLDVLHAFEAPLTDARSPDMCAKPSRLSF
jgi:hypothetical protein